VHTREGRDGRLLLSIGETMGRFSAGGIGMLDFVPDFTLGLAGAESNVAIAAARLGAPAAWVGRVGPDSTGDLIERRLRAEGVYAVAIRDPAPTGLMVLSRRTNSSVEVDYHRSGSAGTQLRAQDVSADLLNRAGIVHLTGITPALSAGARRATFEIAAAARSAGALVSVDVNFRSKLWSAQQAAPVLADLVRAADIVFAGPDEAQLVLGSQEDHLDELAGSVHHLGPAEVIIKDGARGCVALLSDPDGGGRHQVAAPQVQVADPVGAGDAFVGGYLAERLRSEPGLTRLRTAVRTGSYAVTVPGDCEGLPTRTELEKFDDADDITR